MPDPPKRQSCPVCEDGDTCATPLCEVRPAAGGEVLFLIGEEPFACRHKLAFGHGYVCTNPERRRFFKEHGY